MKFLGRRRKNAKWEIVFKHKPTGALSALQSQYANKRVAIEDCSSRLEFFVFPDILEEFEIIQATRL